MPQHKSMELDARLSALGFAFNPYDRLEASNDPYIHEDLVGHDMFSIAWEASPTAIFSPAGGGKTAMRISTLRTCWLSSSQKRKFPISYDIPVFCSASNPTSLAAHQVSLAAAVATDIFLACAYRPELYLQLPPKCRCKILSLLQQALPTNLAWNLVILAETANAHELSLHLDRTYVLPDPPTEQELSEFIRVVQADLKKVTFAEIPQDTLFEQFLEVILQDLAFESIFILLDGLDGSTSLALDSTAQYRIIAPFCEKALRWEKERIFLKAFLPLELEATIASQAESFYERSLRATITWEIPNLAEILRRRVYVASHGRFGSLDALSSPALRDVETQIAQLARPLPREVIVLAGKVLENYTSRGDKQGYLELEDISRATEKYQRGLLLIGK